MHFYFLIDNSIVQTCSNGSGGENSWNKTIKKQSEAILNMCTHFTMLSPFVRGLHVYIGQWLAGYQFDSWAELLTVTVAKGVHFKIMIKSLYELLPNLLRHIVFHLYFAQLSSMKLTHPLKLAMNTTWILVQALVLIIVNTDFSSTSLFLSMPIAFHPLAFIFWTEGISFFYLKNKIKFKPFLCF